MPEMTLKEAIELIQKDINDENVDWDSPLGRAYKLGFEALKAVYLCRQSNMLCPGMLMPGETEE